MNSQVALTECSPGTELYGGNYRRNQKKQKQCPYSQRVFSLEFLNFKTGRDHTDSPAQWVFFCFCFCFFFALFIFFYFWLCWVFVSVRGLSLVVASGGRSSSPCAGLSLSRPPLLRSTGSKRAGSVLVAHGRSRSAACGIFPDQGSNPCPLHWQADSQPLRHQGSPRSSLLNEQIFHSDISQNSEKILQDSLKTLESWGFVLSV